MRRRDRAGPGAGREAAARRPAGGGPVRRPEAGRGSRSSCRGRCSPGGLELVDTPGVGGVSPAAALSALDLLPTADAVLVVSDTSQEYTAPELAFLRQCTVLCPVVVSVLTKTDVHQHWRQVAELDRAHLARAGLDVPVVPVASPLEQLAVERVGRRAARRSPASPPCTSSCSGWSGGPTALTVRSIRHDLRSVGEQLTLSLQAELDALRDPAKHRAAARPGGGPGAASRTSAAAPRAGRPCSRDGVADLMADIDYDLRDRSRLIIREAEATIDAGDPGPAVARDRRLAGGCGSPRPSGTRSSGPRSGRTSWRPR